MVWIGVTKTTIWTLAKHMIFTICPHSDTYNTYVHTKCVIHTNTSSIQDRYNNWAFKLYLLTHENSSLTWKSTQCCTTKQCSYFRFYFIFFFLKFSIYHFLNRTITSMKIIFFLIFWFSFTFFLSHPRKKTWSLVNSFSKKKKIVNKVFEPTQTNVKFKRVVQLSHLLIIIRCFCVAN